MAITLKRQLTDDEKKEILKVHGRKCFATGHEIPEDESLHFDHIRAFSMNGRSELDNIAPMCEMHNLEKGVLPFTDFRVKLRLNEFFAEGNSLTLRIPNKMNVSCVCHSESCSAPALRAPGTRAPVEESDMSYNKIRVPAGRTALGMTTSTSILFVRDS
jgi:hypothetical protein